MARLNGEQLADALSDFVNGGSEAEAFIAAVLRDHRTLQQGVMRLFMKLVVAWASVPEGRYDLRNEGTIQLAREIVEKCEPCLPLI